MATKQRTIKRRNPVHEAKKREVGRRLAREFNQEQTKLRGGSIEQRKRAPSKEGKMADKYRRQSALPDDKQ